MEKSATVLQHTDSIYLLPRLGVPRFAPFLCAEKRKHLITLQLNLLISCQQQKTYCENLEICQEMFLTFVF